MTAREKTKGGSHGTEPDGPSVASGPVLPQHVHLAAMRKLSKIVLACLWEVWREELGLPTRGLYVVEKLGHKNVVRPEDLVGQEVTVCQPGL